MSERIARQIVELIDTQDLPEGSAFPPERVLMEQLGVGRATLRESLRLLEMRGVITIRQGPSGGPVVRRPRPTDLSENLSLILQFEKATLLDVMEARTLFEPAVARLAAQRATARSIAGLRESVERARASISDERVVLEEGARFHSLVAEAGGTAVLRVFSESLSWIADGAVEGIGYSAPRQRAICSIHERIFEAIESRDDEQAESLMHKHLNGARSYWERKYGTLVRKTVRWTF